jgi:hypothetical protein
MKYYLDYIAARGGNAEVSEWINTTLNKQSERRPLDQTEVEHILDYLISDAAPRRLRRMSYDHAQVGVEAWSRTNQKHGRNIIETDADVETIHSFEDGGKIVRLLTKNAFQREGFLMSHCVGGYNPNSQDLFIYSYRDKKNIPHATFEVQKKNKQISQIKGKGNGSIHPRYIHPILAFLEKIGMKVQSGEMANLGYHHVPIDILHLIAPIKGALEQLQDISGEKYFYWSGSWAS